MENSFEKLEKRIFSKLETEASINNFLKEREENKSKEKYTILKRVIAAIVSITAISGTVLFAYSKMQEFNYIDYGYSLTGQENDSVKNSTESGYAENLNTEYTYVKGIGCKINSYFISDNAVGIQLDFDFSNKKLEKNNKIVTKFIIYDEKGNVYGKTYFSENFIKTLKETKYINNFYRKHNLNNNDELANQKFDGPLYQNEQHVIYRILLSSPNDRFPRNKKLYVNIHDIGYNTMATDAKYDFKSITKNKIEWNFEIDVSEKFYNRTNDEYKLKENEENFELENMIVTDTQTTITYKGKKIDIIKGIVDNNGNLYKRGTARYLDNQYSTNCSFNKSMETTPLYLRIEVNGEIKDIELEKVNE